MGRSPASASCCRRMTPRRLADRAERRGSRPTGGLAGGFEIDQLQGVVDGLGVSRVTGQLRYTGPSRSPIWPSCTSTRRTCGTRSRGLRARRLGSAPARLGHTVLGAAAARRGRHAGAGGRRGAHGHCVARGRRRAAGLRRRSLPGAGCANRLGRRLLSICPRLPAAGWNAGALGVSCAGLRTFKSAGGLAGSAVLAARPRRRARASGGRRLLPHR